MKKAITNYLRERTVPELISTPLTIVIILIIIIFKLLSTCHFNQDPIEPVEIKIEPIPIIVNEPYKATRIDEYVDKIENIDKKQEPIEYYKEYIDITNDYSDVAELQSIYDYYSDEEIKYLQKVVETECHGASFECKANIARVVLNRVDSERFPDTIKGVVTSAGQFSYGRSNIDEETKLACEYAFSFLTPAEECLFFHSNSKTDTFSRAPYRFSDGCHHFYG